MDNNNNNSSGFVPYGQDPYENVLIDNFVEQDPALVYLVDEPQPNIQNELLPEQNNPFGVEQGNVNVSFTEYYSMIQDQYPMHCNDNNFTVEGGVPNCEVGTSSKKRKYPFTDPDHIEDNNNNNNSYDFTDPYIEDDNNNNYPNGGGGGGGGLVNFEAGPSNLNQPASANIGPRYWPPIPRPFFCACCQVLRKTILTNVSNYERLEIHGRIGLISHAIIQNQSMTPGDPACNDYQMIDFTKGGNAQVKSFLSSYIEHKGKLGYVIVEDPFSAFYEAVCTGSEWIGKLNNEDDDDEIPKKVENKTANNKKARSDRQEQIKIIKELKLEHFSGVFHLTIRAASKELKISEGIIKEFCSKVHFYTWPQRRLQPHFSRLKVLKNTVDSQDPEVRRSTRMEIQRIKQKMIGLCAGITPTGIEIPQFEEE